MQNEFCEHSYGKYKNYLLGKEEYCGYCERKISKRTLQLTLKAEPFKVMVTGEKKLEFREPGSWILSRLNKPYDLVKFTNGYNANSPYFIAKFIKWWIGQSDTEFTYSNGLIVPRKKGMVVIQIGEIIERGNLKWQRISHCRLFACQDALWRIKDR